MDDFTWQVVWVATATVLVTYPSMLFIGSLGAHSQYDDTVIAFDLVEGATHTITGTLVLPTDCHDLFAHVEEPEPGTGKYLIRFETWQQPARECPKQPVLKRFRVVTFAPPDGVTFSATLDDRDIDLLVIPAAGK